MALVDLFFPQQEASADLTLSTLLEFLFFGKLNRIRWADKAIPAFKELGLDNPEIFQTADIDDHQTINLLKNSPPLTLLSMGSFDKSIFDGLFTYTGTNSLSSIREGYLTLSNLLPTGALKRIFFISLLHRITTTITGSSTR